MGLSPYFVLGQTVPDVAEPVVPTTPTATEPPFQAAGTSTILQFLTGDTLLSTPHKVRLNTGSGTHRLHLGIRGRRALV